MEIKYANGDKYIGEMKNGLRNGNWTDFKSAVDVTRIGTDGKVTRGKIVDKEFVPDEEE